MTSLPLFTTPIVKPITGQNTQPIALQLYKNFNDQKQGETWLDLNLQQSYGQRNKFVMIVDNSTHKVGRNNLNEVKSNEN